MGSLTILEQLKLPGGSNDSEVLVPGSFTSLARAEDEIGPEAQEDDKRHHLERETGYHDVAASKACTGSICGSRQTSSSALKNQRSEIRTHECYGVCPWAQSRDSCTVCNDDPSKAEVNGSGQKGWSNGQWDQVTAWC